MSKYILAFVRKWVQNYWHTDICIISQREVSFNSVEESVSYDMDCLFTSKPVNEIKSFTKYTMNKTSANFPQKKNSVTVKINDWMWISAKSEFT